MNASHVLACSRRPHSSAGDEATHSGGHGTAGRTDRNVTANTAVSRPADGRRRTTDGRRVTRDDSSRSACTEAGSEAAT